MSEQQYILPDVQPTDWSIGDLYNKSWELVKKHKVLWLFGMAAAAYSGGGGAFNWVQNVPTGFGDTDYKFTAPSPAPKSSEELDGLFNNLPPASEVLGTNTSAIGDTLVNLFSGIPVYIWILLGLQIFALIIIGFVIGLIGNAWANGSLINAIQLGLDGKNVSIRDSSEKTFPAIKPLALLFFVPGLVLAIATALVIGVIFLVANIAPSQLTKVILFIFSTIAVLAFLYFLIHLVFSQIWAQRMIVLDNKQWREALFVGYRISRRKKWSMILLGIVNTIMSFFVILVPILLLITIGVSGFVLKGGIPSIGWSLISLAGVLLIVFIFGYSLLTGILTAFKAAVWTIAYHKIRGKYEERF